ncbi:MAG: YIP1 family protein [Actinobacteria bacterium]|nr:YIP1 family protein [Actinomycetota bacterium]
MDDGKEAQNSGFEETNLTTDVELYRTNPPSGDRPKVSIGANRPKVSVWEMMYGALFSPVQAMAQIADARPVGTALLIKIGLYVFALVIGLLVQTPTIDLGELPPGVPGELAGVMRQIVPAMVTVVSIMGGVFSIIAWFTLAAVYRVLGELMGDAGDGRAMLATIGFAALPEVLVPPVQVIARLLNLGFLSGIATFGAWIWSIILTVMGIRATLRTSTGRALGIYLVPWAAAAAVAIIFAIALGAALVPLLRDVPRSLIPNLP